MAPILLLPPAQRPCQVSKDDHVLQLLQVCSHALAKAQELMDNAGLVLSPEEASAPCFVCHLCIKDL